jgi:hypothetical protein
VARTGGNPEALAKLVLKGREMGISENNVKLKMAASKLQAAELAAVSS